MSETNVENNQSNDSKKIITLIILILTIMVCTTSATYAYFAIGAKNTTTVTGKAATASLSLTVNKILPTAANTGVIVPQYSYNGTSATYSSTNDILMKAVNNTTPGKCVDGNKNIICQVYTIQITNNSTATASIRGTFSLTGGTFNNLKWYILAQGASTVPSDAATKKYTNINSSGTLNQRNGNTTRYIYGYAKSNTALTNSDHGFDSSTLGTITLTSGASYYYTIIIWIEETDSDQSATNTGTFTGTIEFYAVNNSGNKINGITSTITS